MPSYPATFARARLNQSRALDTKIALTDMKRFLDAAAADDSLDPKALGLGRTTLTDFLGRIAQAYGLKETQEG